MTSFKLNFFMSGFANIVWTIAQLISLQFIFSRINEFDGWSYGDLMLLLAFGQIYVYLSFTIFDINFTKFPQKLIDGTFDTILLKPMSPKFFVAFEELSISQIVPMLVTTVPMLIIGLTNRAAVDLTSLGLAILMNLIGITIFFFFSMSFSGLTLFFENAQNIQWVIKSGVSDITRVPLEIFPSFVRSLLTFVLPFAFVTYYPVLVLQGNLNIFYAFTVEICLLVIFYLTSNLLWTFGLKRYGGVA